jgi:hypothetical protein
MTWDPALERREMTEHRPIDNVLGWFKALASCPIDALSQRGIEREASSTYIALV